MTEAWVILAFAGMFGIGWSCGVLWKEGTLREDLVIAQRWKGNLEAKP